MLALILMRAYGKWLRQAAYVLYDPQVKVTLLNQSFTDRIGSVCSPFPATALSCSRKFYFEDPQNEPESKYRQSYRFG